jgi:hypothetical protein
MRYAVASQVLTGIDGPMQRGAHGLHVSGDVNTRLVELTRHGSAREAKCGNVSGGLFALTQW